LHAIECNCVSEKISQQIAVNISRLFVSDYGIGITGYAARLPEKNINDLFAYYAISANEKILQSGKITTTAEEGLPAQLFFVNRVLKIFNETI
jgi:hypothetical protein